MSILYLADGGNGNFRGIEPLNCLAIPPHPAKG
jgi:hypothetical protein